MLVSENISHKTLSKNLWDCKDVKFIRDTNNKIGLWNLKDSSKSYKHYGVEERILREQGTHSTEYKNTISYLYRCINSTKQIDIIKLKQHLNLITKK